MPTDSCCPKCDALREVEWTPTDGDDDRCDDRCPGCFNYYEQGHAKPCRLAAALAAPCAVKLMREAARAVDPLLRESDPGGWSNTTLAIYQPPLSEIERLRHEADQLEKDDATIRRFRAAVLACSQDDGDQKNPPQMKVTP